MQEAKTHIERSRSWWKGKVVIVTGGANGIGRSIVYQVAVLGGIPVIIDNDVMAIQKIHDELIKYKCEYLCIRADLTKKEACQVAIKNAMSKYLSISVLVNNIGANDKKGLLTANPEQFEESLKLNLMLAYNITHYAVPHMIRDSSIINILSKVYTTGQGGTSGYAAAKGGLAALTREWAVDLAHYGIRVNAVIPAEVMTAGYERWLGTFPNKDERLRSINKNIPLGQRMTRPEEIADMVVFLASPAASHITAQLMKVDGGYCDLDRSMPMSKL